MSAFGTLYIFSEKSRPPGSKHRSRCDVSVQKAECTLFAFGIWKSQGTRTLSRGLGSCSTSQGRSALLQLHRRLSGFTALPMDIFGRINIRRAPTLSSRWQRGRYSCVTSLARCALNLLAAIALISSLADAPTLLSLPSRPAHKHVAAQRGRGEGTRGLVPDLALARCDRAVLLAVRAWRDVSRIFDLHRFLEAVVARLEHLIRKKESGGEECELRQRKCRGKCRGGLIR